MVREQLAQFAGRDPYRQLLFDVTPADDGSLDPHRVARNMDRFANLADHMRNR